MQPLEPIDSDEQREEFRRRTSLVNIMRWSIPSLALLTLPLTCWLQRGVAAALGVANPLGAMPWGIRYCALFVLSAVTTQTSWKAMMRCIDFHEPGILSAAITLFNVMALLVANLTMLISGYLAAEEFFA